MATKFYWQLPTAKDARHGDATRQRRGEHTDPSYPKFGNGVSDPRKNAFNYYDYLHQVTKGAELAGFDGVQVPDYPEGEESWIVAGYIARSTKRLTILTQFDAARGSAVYAAKNAVSFQRYTGGRFAWQITEGEADVAARKRAADFVPKSDILPRIEEFITVAKGVITTYPFNFVGRFFEVEAGGFQGPLSERKVPPVYLSGKSPEALALSAKQSDVHILDATDLEDAKKQIANFNALAASLGRQPKIALRIDLFARETKEEAVHDAKRFIEQTGFDGKAITESSSLWVGVTKQHTGADAVLVGSYQELAEALASYASLGVSEFILAAVPHFEEAYRIGEYVLPLVNQLTQDARKAA